MAIHEAAEPGKHLIGDEGGRRALVRYEAWGYSYKYTRRPHSVLAGVDYISRVFVFAFPPLTHPVLDTLHQRHVHEPRRGHPFTVLVPGAHVARRDARGPADGP